MVTKETIFDLFRDKGFISGGEFYLSSHIGLKFVDACEKNSLAVVGVEAFKIEGISILPQIDLIADFSMTEANNWSEFCKKCNQSARDFLQNIDCTPVLFVNFSLIDNESWDQAEYGPI